MDSAYDAMLAHGWPGLLVGFVLLGALSYVARWADKRAARRRR